MKTEDIAKGASEKASPIAGVMEDNIKAIVEHRKQDERERPLEQRIADKITGFTGNMAFVYVHVILLATWVAWNTGIAGFKPIDPDFIALSIFASVEAIFLSVFVLITQNRMTQQADNGQIWIYR